MTEHTAAATTAEDTSAENTTTTGPATGAAPAAAPETGASASSPKRRRRLGRILRWGAWALLALLLMQQIVGFVNPAPAVGHWRSAEARATYETAREELLATLPPPDEIRDVATSSGTAHVYTWHGDAPGEPVLLLPGYTSGAMMWAENLPDLVGQRTIHAVDAIGDAGGSTQSVPLVTPEDEAEWISEALTGLGEDRAHVVGHSFGGANAAMFALRHPEQVASLALLEPVLIIRPLPASTYFWTLVAELPLPKEWRDHALSEIGGATSGPQDPNDPMLRLVSSATDGYSRARPMPRELTDAEWQALAATPLRVDLGGAQSLAGGQEAADRIAALDPDATVEVWPNGTHSLPMDEHAAIGAALVEFWISAEG